MPETSRCHLLGLVSTGEFVVRQTRHAQVQGIEHSLVPDGNDRHVVVVRGVRTARVLALAVSGPLVGRSSAA